MLMNTVSLLVYLCAYQSLPVLSDLDDGLLVLLYGGFTMGVCFRVFR